MIHRLNTGPDQQSADGMRGPSGLLRRERATRDLIEGNVLEFLGHAVVRAAPWALAHGHFSNIDDRCSAVRISRGERDGTLARPVTPPPQFRLESRMTLIISTMM
jgi:hypothetical protein